MRQTLTLNIKLLLVLFGILGFVAPTMALDELTEKGIQIRGSHGLEVHFKPYKRHFRAGEPIRFDVEGNRDFYLYLFNLDKDQDEAVMLLPNRYDIKHRYRLDRAYTVPAKAEFYADKAGLETLVVIASTQKLEFSETVYGPSDDSEFYDFGSAIEAEGIIDGLSVDNLPENEDIVIKRLSLRIGDDESDFL